MGREAERGVPAVEELDPTLRQTVVVTGPVDLAEQSVDHVFVAVLELVVPSIRRPPWIAERLPGGCAGERPPPIAAVPLDDVVLSTQLEPVRVVVVEVRADDLVLRWHAAT